MTLKECLKELGADELRVLEVIANRLVMGKAQYGALRLSVDRRSWTKEAAEEACDLAVYLSILTLMPGAS